MEWDISLFYKNKKKSINSILIISFTLIMIITIVLIKIFVIKNFKESFRKYVNDSNMVEVEHLIKFDLNNIYKYDKWDTKLIKELGIDSIRKGIAINIYDEDNNEVWSVFKEEKVLSDSTLRNISKNMQNINNSWDNEFEKYSINIYDYNNNLVGYANIAHYASTYYLENDMSLFNSINKILIIIGLVAIVGIIAISVIISKSISIPLSRISKKTKVIEEGNYKDEVHVKCNVKEIDELITSINNLGNALDKQETLRKRLTGDIAHELRTPLSCMKGYLDAIISGIWEPTNERLISINEEVNRITNLVDELRSLAKYDSEESILKKESVNLRNLLLNVVYSFESNANEKNITIEVSELADIAVEIDKGKFTQVIINLLSNAIKYSNIKGKIRISSYINKNIVYICIDDNGIGIPKEDLDYIFERFYRVDKSRSRNAGGLGVGLTISKSIIEAHNGKILVNSELGKGSKFTILIPLYSNKVT